MDPVYVPAKFEVRTCKQIRANIVKAKVGSYTLRSDVASNKNSNNLENKQTMEDSHTNPHP